MFWNIMYITSSFAIKKKPPASIENERENFVLISISDGEGAWFLVWNVPMDQSRTARVRDFLFEMFR